MAEQPPAVVPVWTLPVLPLQNIVLFPSLFLPLTVGKPQSLAGVEAALASEEKALLAVALREHAADPPRLADLAPIGTRAVIRRMARGDDAVELLVQGAERVRVVRAAQTEPYLSAYAEAAPLPPDPSPEAEALFRAVVDLARKALELAQPETPVNLDQVIAQVGDPVRVAYLIGSMLGMSPAAQQALLEAPTQAEALRLLHEALAREVQVLGLRHQIASKAQTEMGKEQREYMLRQQLRAIQEELGGDTPEKAEVAELRRRLAEADLPDEVRKEADRELNRLERLPAAAPDFQIARTYLDLVLELPWRKSAESALDLTRARAVLDEDHFDLEEIKGRILEYLAVLKLNPKASAPILCLVGPPGVGKTSLGQSIARATGRRFEHASLGGMHDEAELRGHRRTYVGAMPGRILQAIRRAGVNNPVLVLDEVDKIGRDYRGDPAAALLEILDPAQNNAFRDNYLDLPFDLSKVFFITTANTLDTIPRPLLDRMEILKLSGYSEEEKLQIARRYLIPRRVAQAGLTAGDVSAPSPSGVPQGSGVSRQLILPDETLQRVIARYTREAGVRQLEQALARLARKAAVRFAEGRTEPVTVGPDDLPDLLGPERFTLERARADLAPGVATGLAWTEAGGEVLYVEASLLPGARGLRLTGQLGKVMKESARAARSYVWAHAEELGIDPALFRTAAVHIHVPAGAVPKDGPSAGVAMVTALASLYTGVPARSDTAMTGEITLSGLVLPIGGVKEKVLAARAAGIGRVVLPRANEKDLRELPDHVRREMEVVLVGRIGEALAATLTRPRVAVYHPILSEPEA